MKALADRFGRTAGASHSPAGYDETLAWRTRSADREVFFEADSRFPDLSSPAPTAIRLADFVANAGRPHGHEPT